jgi:hypothetical protein
MVISRFHWIVATIWTESIEEDNKPKVNFVRGVHTPIAESKNDDIRYIEFETNVPVEERFAIANFYMPLFIRCWKSVKFSGAKKGYAHLIVQGAVPPKYVFNLSEIKFSFVIGHLPELEDLPKVLREKL